MIEGFMEVELLVTKRDDDRRPTNQPGEYRAICLGKVGRQSFAILLKYSMKDLQKNLFFRPPDHLSIAKHCKSNFELTRAPLGWMGIATRSSSAALETKLRGQR